MLRWTNSFWLKREYFIVPQSAVSGALLFAAGAVGSLPLKLSVEAGGDAFTFYTAHKRD